MFKRAIQLAAVLIVAWAGAFGIAFAVIEWRVEEDGQMEQVSASSTERNLTATEAAALAQKFLATTESESLARFASCEADDFNTQRNEWIVSCSVAGGPGTLHFVVGVKDDSRKAQLLSP